MPDVLVTGLPRSGLTVASALIDYLPNSVCLNAPLWQMAQARRMRHSLTYCKWLAGDFLWRRQELLRQKPMRDLRAADGAPLLDGLKDRRQPHGESGKPAPVLFKRPGLKGDFILGMKHHALYTALLPLLAEMRHFKIIAVIRNPVDTITSWQSFAAQPFAQGNVPVAARFWPDAARIQSSEGSALDRMVQLYDAHLQRYHELGDAIHVIKYEDLVGNPDIISQLFGIEPVSAAAKMIERQARIRSAHSATPIREALRKYGVFTKYYYPDA